MSEIKKGPGRPAKKHWKPYSPMSVEGKDPKYGYKFVLMSKLEGRKHEGWEVCLASIDTNLKVGCGVTNDMFITSDVGEKLVLCKMPIEMCLEREDYFEDLNSRKLGEAKSEFKEIAQKAGVQLSDKEYE